MDFTYDEGQLALRDVARQALERHAGPAEVRRLADDPAGVTPELWSALVELGWTGLLVPEAAGGSGAGLVETCIVLEQMGRVPLPGPFLSSAVVATLAARALGADHLVGDLAAGTTRGTVALHEVGNGDPLGTVRARARRRGAGWVVSGLKPLVLDGHTADWAIVAARTEEGVRSFLLADPKTAGRAEAVPTLDPTRKAARLVLDDAPVEALGPTGSHHRLWRRVLDDVAVALSAETVGCCDRALADSVAYGKARVVFGRPIAGFQVVKHKVVDMFQALEMARVGVQYAAWCADTDDPGRERAVAMAAAYAAEAGTKVTGENIQLHGGVGFTWANDAHFLFKRAKQNEVLLGGAPSHRRRVAALVVDGR